MSDSNGKITKETRRNPFVHQIEIYNSVEKIKTALLTVLLLPFRIIFICIFLIIAWIFACVGLYGISKEDLRTKPIQGWRKHLKYFICVFGRWSYLAGGMSITVKGQQATRNEAKILVIAPHSTFFDSVIVYVTNMASVIVRNESMDNYAGKLINFTQPIYVWRDDPNSRHNTIQAIIDRANSEEDWPQILVFPEGTCTNRSCLITFKPGAFYPAVPVQPVCIRYPNKLDTVTWTWMGPGVLKLLYLTLTQMHSSCEIEFLPVYHPSDEEKKNPKLYARNVQRLMANSLEIPVSDYTFDHCQMMNHAKKMNIPNAASIVEISKLKSSIGITSTNIEEQLNEKNFDCSLEEFALRLKVPSTDNSLSILFSIFDEENSGRIDFRDYLLCTLFLLKFNEPIINLLESTFKIFDGSDGEGHLNKNNFYLAVKNILNMSKVESDNLFVRIDSDLKNFISFEQLKQFTENKTEFSKIYKINGHPTEKPKEN